MSDTPASTAAASPRRLSDPRLLIPLALFALYVIWGSTYLGIRYALESYPPFLLAGVRFLGGDSCCSLASCAGAGCSAHGKRCNGAMPRSPGFCCWVSATDWCASPNNK